MGCSVEQCMRTWLPLEYRLRLQVCLAMLSTASLPLYFLVEYLLAEYLLPERRLRPPEAHCLPYISAAALRMLAMAAASLLMVWRAKTRQMKLVAEVWTLCWNAQALWLLQITVRCWDALAAQYTVMPLLVAFLMNFAMTLNLVVERLQALQLHAMLDLHVPRWLVLVVIAPAPCWWLLGELAFLAFVAFWLVGFAVLLLLSHALLKTWRMASAAALAWPNGPEVLATLRTQVLGSVVGSLWSFVGSFAFLSLLNMLEEGKTLKDFSATNVLAEAVLCVQVLTDVFMGLALSGALSGALKGTEARAKAEVRRRRRWQRQNGGAWRAAASPWDVRVLDLAHRGVTLRALLAFYKALGTSKVMPDFDGAASTTEDVVRKAIIPLSRDARAAYSTVIMQGPVPPERMVTHNWSNLYRDTMAAILADALGEAEFSQIAMLLMRDVATLEAWVEARGVGGRSYWFCAFAVNQHLGICSEQRHGYAPCNCGLPKAWNDTPPLLPDGRGIICEMNKFDDMMKLLSRENSDFQEVVAVDQSFVLFSRAWCVAEIATANEGGMGQQLKIWSRAALQLHRDSLKKLRVEDMQASRPQDVQQILDRISDPEAFNRALRSLLLEELLPAWCSLDSQEQMALAGQMIRWVMASNACEEAAAGMGPREYSLPRPVTRPRVRRVDL